MFKKKACLVLSMAMTVGLLAGCGAKGSSTTGDIKIGVVLPLTGPVSSFGKSGQNGIKLLEDQVNKDGGINGRKIKFLFEDDEGKPDTATTVGTKLISSDNVVAIVGPLTSGSCIALGPIATQSKVPMITGSGTNPDVTKKGGEYVYRACFIDPFQGTVISKFASTDLKESKFNADLYKSSWVVIIFSIAELSFASCNPSVLIRIFWFYLTYKSF